MYGTVAHFHIKPGMDASVQDCYLAVMFTSREAYFAHAEHPEVVAIDRRLMTLLEREPEWHDGEIVYALKAENAHQIEETLATLAEDCLFEDMALGQIFQGHA